MINASTISPDEWKQWYSHSLGHKQLNKYNFTDNCRFSPTGATPNLKHLIYVPIKHTARVYNSRKQKLSNLVILETLKLLKERQMGAYSKSFIVQIIAHAWC